jgi:16S rRNA (uracil1498-N3)-methyltransferase
MRRFWVDPGAINGDQVRFEDEAYRHVVTVSRRSVGDRFEVLAGDGQALFVEVVAVEKRTALAHVLERRNLPSLPQPYIRLALSVPRPKTLDAIVEKAVELGVQSLHLLTSDYSFVRDLRELKPERLDRLERIVAAATRQSARGALFEIAPALDLKKTLEEMNRRPHAKGLFAYEGTAALGVHAYLQAMAAEMPQEVWLFVGSEGGFSTAEVELFKQFHLEPVTLGEQVLRVETACVALISVIKYALQAGF